MPDVIEKIDGSLIQRGEENNRIYLMKLADGDIPATIARLEEIARENEYTKIIAKIPAHAKPVFEEHGYRQEAAIPRFYHGTEDACFMAKYYSEERSIEHNQERIQQVLDAAREKAGEGVTTELGPEFAWGIADESQAEEISAVYREVFASYPFPIHDPDYILKTMRENVVYFFVRKGNDIVSVASSEMDEASGNVEMTDFATLPEYRGHSFAVFLLDKMENAMRERGIKTAYTIARAVSFGMNITFAKLGYEYGGTLTNNTDISGSVESMNIWYKPLDRTESQSEDREEAQARG